MSKKKDTHISPHFTWDEMTRTTHQEFRARNRNVPPALVIPATALCWGILEPIRHRFDAPIVIHSGYRCPDLNTKVGGTAKSQHMWFKACDFHVIGHLNEDVWRWVWKESGLPFGQVILEPTWVHVSVGWPLYEKEKTGRALTFDGKKYEEVGRSSEDSG